MPVPRTLALLLLLLFSVVVQADNKLTILNWEAYLAEDVIEQWQKETGVTIEQIYIDGDEMRDSILASPARKT